MLNTINLIKFFSQGNPTGHERFFTRFLETNNSFYSHVFQLNINQYFALFFTFFILFFLLKKSLSQKYLFLQVNLFTFISYLISFSVFNTTRIAHYYNPIYLSFFLVLAWVLTNISKNKFIRFSTLVLILPLYIFLNLKSLNYLFIKTGNNQVKTAEIIAQSILQKNPQTPYQTVALPFVETDGHIRYFLEIKGKTPLPADTLTDPKELYVLCFENCQVLGNPQWQIASFKNARIDKIWTIEGVTIYKLTHS